ncbi:MAG TPA: nuclease domain-containing protein, partial [Chitinophagaceae bacterium]|nr:nuclease domain-containing protein [Chitinophagaceae bacterium]
PSTQATQQFSYEYWLFFKLLDLFQKIFEIEPKDISDLIQETSDGLNLQIKQGKYTALKGVYDSGSRKVNIRFNYNRSFSGNKNYPDAGSWTTTLRPDYTLSFWPVGISEPDAEKQELIVHIHFDAKYKVANLVDFLGKNSEDGLDDEKFDNRKGLYKNADLLKMHAYKDAIRRTGGAYVLYPGTESIKQKGFHEIIPGLGAFPVKPSKTDNGIGDLKSFILEILSHFINRASQREKLAYRTFDIYKAPPETDHEVNEALPEPYNSNRNLIPDDTYVLIGFYSSESQYNWIKRNKLYNFRMGSETGSLILDSETVSARYLLLHTHGESQSGELWRIMSRGPKVFSRKEMIEKGYPKCENEMQEFYLIVQLEKVVDPEFANVQWAFKQLKRYAKGRASAFPFTASLSDLMKAKVK